VDLALVEADPTSPAAAALIAALDAEFHVRYPGAPVFGIDAVSLLEQGGVFLLAQLDGMPVGCGALRPLDSRTAEVKRMFVRPDARGRRIARAVLARLEAIAAARGYLVCRLETGIRQPEAIGLYESAGYTRIPCFAEYASSPHSVCYEKRLAPPW
jgi:GNAT superfamily N-acetyltransferase